MSTATQRITEILIGFLLVGYCAYAIYTGHIHGKYRSYTRGEDTWPHWVTVLLSLGIGAAFLFGFTSWRE